MLENADVMYPNIRWAYGWGCELVGCGIMSNTTM